MGGFRPARLAAALALAGVLAGCASERAVRTAGTRDRAFELFEKGLTREAAGQYSDAIRYFTQAIELNQRPAFYFKAGSAYQQLGEPGRALYFYDKALELAPDYNLASSRRELALLEMKGEEFKLRSAPRDSGNELAMAAESGTSARSLPRVESAFEASQGSNRARDAIFPELRISEGERTEDLKDTAANAASQGRWADAARAWGRVVRTEPDSLESRLGHAKALLRAGRTKSALDEYETASRIDPQSPDVFIQWGNALAESGDLYMAEVRFRDALEVDPVNARAYNNLGSTYIARGFPEEAINFLGQAIELDPDFAPAYLNKALALQKTEAPVSDIISSLESYIGNDGERQIEAEAWLIRLRRGDGS